MPSPKRFHSPHGTSRYHIIPRMKPHSANSSSAVRLIRIPSSVRSAVKLIHQKRKSGMQILVRLISVRLHKNHSPSSDNILIILNIGANRLDVAMYTPQDHVCCLRLWRESLSRRCILSLKEQTLSTKTILLATSTPNRLIQSLCEGTTFDGHVNPWTGRYCRRLELPSAFAQLLW